MTKGFDDVTLTFYKTKLCDMTKTIGDTKVKLLTLCMVWSNCPDDSKEVKQLYLDLMLLVISLLTLLMSVGFNIPLILT